VQIAIQELVMTSIFRGIKRDELPIENVEKDHHYGLPIKALLRFVCGSLCGFLWPFSNGPDQYLSFSHDVVDIPFYSEYSVLIDHDHRILQDDKYASNSYGSTTSTYGGSSPNADWKGVVDYSILSVAVLTLGLLLVVEFMLHQLDHMASHRRFFKIVTRTFYRECECEIFGIYSMRLPLSQHLKLSIRSGYLGYSRVGCIFTSNILQRYR